MAATPSARVPTIGDVTGVSPAEFFQPAPVSASQQQLIQERAGELFQPSPGGPNFGFEVIDGTLRAIPQARGGGFFNEPVEVHDDEVVAAVPGGGFFVQPKGKTKPKRSAQAGGFFDTQPRPTRSSGETPEQFADRLRGTSFTTDGGGGFGDFSQFFDIPQLPTFPPITQEQIQGFATEFAPPAVRDVFRGQRPAPLRFSNIPGFQLPSPSLLGSLTPRDRAASAGFLAPFGHTPGDVETAIMQRFAPPQGRPRATLQAGF